MVFNKDQPRNRKDNCPEELAVLRKPAPNLVQLEPSKGSIWQIPISSHPITRDLGPPLPLIIRALIRHVHVQALSLEADPFEPPR